ncbi:MAG: hypothetical protein H6Q66_1401 [Firmicutes bacterium]|nr:hypothetical protein [Bacillota bacterium]
MGSVLMKSIIGRFDNNSFKTFFQRMLDQSDFYNGKTKKFSNIDDRIFARPAERF